MTESNFSAEERALLGDTPLPAPIVTGAPVGRELAMGAYEGASSVDRSIALWAPSMRSADMDILPEKAMLDARVQDTLRNDAYVQGGGELHKDNIVGAMYLLNAKPNATVLGWTDDRASAFQAEVEAKFTLWAESPNCWPDAARMNTFTGLIRLAIGIYVAAGETLSTAEWIREDVRPYRTAIQMLDVARLSTPFDRTYDSNVKGGVEKNAWGAPVAYHIRRAHPSDYNSSDRMFWDRVPAYKPWGRTQVIHILEQQRIHQSRGVSEMVAALKETRMTKKFRDIVLQNAVINATFAASIESELPPEAVFQALGSGNLGEATIQAAIQQYAEGYLGAIASYTDGSRNMAIDGVKIPHLYPGTKLQLRGAGQGGPLGTEFEQSLLRYLAGSLGVSYEQLSRDYTKTNYSSARAAMNETHKHMQSRKRMVADRLASIIYRLWLEEAISADVIESFRAREMPRLYTNGRQNMLFEAITGCEWIGASRGQIDELKETQAAVLRLKYNLSTHEQELARLGQDWRVVFAQREREAKDLEKRGLNPDPQDNMVNAASGAPREDKQDG